MTKLNREVADLGDNEDDNGDEDDGENTQPHETVPTGEPPPPPPAA